MADDYLPSRWAEVYHALDTEEALGAGAAGPGKTSVLLRDPIPQIQVEHTRCMNKRHPHHLEWGRSTGWALHLRRTVKRLEQTIQRAHRLFPTIDSQVRWDEQKNTFTFSSGYKFQFGHCKDPNSWMDYYGNEYSHIAFDELVEFDEEQYDQIKSRKRSADPVLSMMLKVRAMSNPVTRRDAADGFFLKDPQWVRRYFVDPAPEGKTILKQKVRLDDGTIVERRRIYLPAKLSDNPNKSFVLQYEAELQAQKPHIRAALLRGDWYATPDSFYGEWWDRRIHVCDPFNIPSDWPKFRSMDWGFKAPGCVLWWAMDPDGNLICTKEYTFQGKNADEVAKEIRAIETAMGLWQGKRSRIFGPADTQLWEERGDSGMTKAASMARLGVLWHRAQKSARAGSGRQGNAEKLIGRLKDHKNKTTTPGIVFFKSCRNCIRTIPGIQTDQRDTELPLDGGEDHWHDAVLYACAHASKGRAGLATIKRKADKFDDDEEDRPIKENRGRYGYGSSVA